MSDSHIDFVNAFPLMEIFAFEHQVYTKWSLMVELPTK